MGIWQIVGRGGCIVLGAEPLAHHRARPCRRASPCRILQRQSGARRGQRLCRLLSPPFGSDHALHRGAQARYSEPPDRINTAGIASLAGSVVVNQLGGSSVNRPYPILTAGDLAGTTFDSRPALSRGVRASCARHGLECSWERRTGGRAPAFPQLFGLPAFEESNRPHRIGSFEIRPSMIICLNEKALYPAEVPLW